ncbi:hypothetical protein CMO84_07955 [Candidatus Woesearchaeota archaeon]|nr:hypothetical protein [Candidatus Woesearchaeota archaeon]
MWTHDRTSRTLLAVTTVGTTALFAGGHAGSSNLQLRESYSDVVDLYDAPTNTWSTARLSQARWALAATTVGTTVGTALFAGGYCYPLPGPGESDSDHGGHHGPLRGGPLVRYRRHRAPLALQRRGGPLHPTCTLSVWG